MDWIDYRQLPSSAGGFSALYLDYLYDFARVKGFYTHSYRDQQSYEAMMAALDAKQADRSELVRVLNEQNRAFGSPARAFENIALLEKPSTYAVVTGQQVGIFGGPLYTVYKTITAIKLADKLQSLFPAKRFVPIFWIEGEDHDFQEMNHISVLDSESGVARLEFLPAGTMPEHNVGPVGELRFDESLEQTLKSLSAALAKTEFKDDLLARVRECYAPGVTFNQAFASWMNRIFEGNGLVFISSNHPGLKRVLSPLFLREIEGFPQISQIVIEQSAELEKHYHAQIKPKSINLFLFHKGGRYLIEPREHDFSLKGTRHFLQKDELVRIANETPELLSPNVVLRPIAQDTLLPTVAYVAGPSEIAYQAQLRPVYDHLGMVQPIMYPRASCTFVEERVHRAMEKYGLDVTMFFGDADRLTSQVLGQIAEVKLDAIFESATATVKDAMGELKYGLQEIDATLAGALETATGRIDAAIGVLREKSEAAQKRKNEIAVRQLERAARSILPNGSLQERELNILYYLNKYGREVLPFLFRELDIEGFKHQLVTL